MASKFLNKSKFVLAMECPTKLFYAGKSEYANQKSEDDFLKALAEGGFQVGELARCYYLDRGPVNLHGLSSDDALFKTNELIQRENVVIFEAAILHHNLFLRADILIKSGNHLRLIEVKSKSIDGREPLPFVGVRGGIDSKWKSYFYDIAFQKHVLIKAFPGLSVSSYLMLVDKATVCPTDALHQNFKITRDSSGRAVIVVSDKLTAADLSEKILREINVDDVINMVFEAKYDNSKKTFSQYIDYLSDCCQKDIKITPVPGGKKCANCEFKTEHESELKGLKSGFKDCWTEAYGFKDNDFDEPTVLDIWDCRNKDKLIESGKVKMNQVDEDDIKPEPDKRAGMSASERRWLQVEKVKNSDNTYELDHGGLMAEVESWRYPLHFIDFETIMPAIPFNKGLHPYQGMAFQFSHHILEKSGSVAHVGQYLNTEIGKNPNLDFVRALMNELDKDNGTIFRYAPHENTYLNMILNQIYESQEPIDDREQLIVFIKSVTQNTDKSLDKWKGERSMVDLWELVKRYYYDPLTNGSNSIKKVFPALLSRSKFLHDKYGKPVYGAEGGIPSLNFKDMQWVQYEGDKIMDPYSLLPNLFDDIDITDEEIELLFGADAVKEGGGASIAYARMQFSEMSDIERNKLVNALLRYCELDTLAMVMIVEAWLDLLK